MKIGNHQITVHDLKDTQHRIGLILGSLHFHQRTDREISQINLKDRGKGFVAVPCQDEGGRYILTHSIPNFEYFYLQSYKIYILFCELDLLEAQILTKEEQQATIRRPNCNDFYPTHLTDIKEIKFKFCILRVKVHSQFFRNFSMALQLISFHNPNFNLSIHSCGNNDVLIEMCHTCDFSLMGVAHIVVFAKLKVVHSHVFTKSIRIVFGVVDKLIFVVIEVILPVGIRQTVLEKRSQYFCLAVEIKEIDIITISQSKTIFIS